jgi:hypothetical protein
MLTLRERKYYFLLGCIPARLGLAALAFYLPEKYLFYLGFLFLGFSIGFLYLYFSKKRMNAPEAGGKTWWANLRLIHGLLYLGAAIYAFQEKRETWLVVLLDTIFGFVAFFSHHNSAVNYS